MEKPFFWALAALSCVMMIMETQPAFPPELGDVMPSSNYVCVGGNLSVACTVKKTLDVVGRNLSLWFNDTPVGVVTSDPWTVQLTLEKVTLDDAGVYYCWLDDDLIGSAEISVEYPVREVENVSCVGYNWASMTCSWSLGDYQHPEHIEVSLLWLCRGCSQDKCPDLTQTSCRWPTVYGSPQYGLNITVQNTVTKDAKSTLHLINFYDRIKPNPVVELEVTERNHSCVELQWSHSEVERIPDMVFRVSQTELPGGLSKVVLPRVKGDRSKVCDLLPATNYSFAVECFPKDGDKGFWSDPASVTTTTLEDVPAEGPPIAAGSFVSNATQCGIKGTRLVTVFWKSVPKASSNGVVRNYTLQYGDKVVEVSGDQYSKQLELDCWQLYRVDLYASTAVGRSLNHTSLEIPSERAGSASSTIQEFLVDITNAQVQAQWRVADVEGNVTVFWCKGEVALCQGEIKWSTVQASTASLPLPVETKEAAHYRYGISSSSGPLGITWATCLADKLAKPATPVQGLVLAQGSAQGVLKAIWQNVQCSYTIPILITVYHLYVCQKPCPQNSTRVISIPGNQSEYELTGLSPGAEYQVNIQAVALGGEGPLSNPYVEMVPERSSGWSTGLVIGVAVGCAVLLTSVVIAAVWCGRNRHKKKMDIMHPEIKHPSDSTYQLVWDKNEVPFAEQPPQRKADHASPLQNGGPVIGESMPGMLPPVAFVGTHRQLNHRREDYVAHPMVPNGKPFGRPGETGVPAERAHVGREDFNRGREAPFPRAAVASGVGGGMELSGYVLSVSEAAPPRPSLHAAADLFGAEIADRDAAGMEQGEDYIIAGEERPVGDSGPNAHNLHGLALGNELRAGEEPGRMAMEIVDPASSSVLPAGQSWGLANISIPRGRAGQGGGDPQVEASESTAQRPVSSPSPPPYIQAASLEGESNSSGPQPYSMPYVLAGALGDEESGADEQQPSSQSAGSGEGVQPSLGQELPPYIQAGSRSSGEESDEGESSSPSSSQPSYIQAGNLDFSGSRDHDDMPSTSTSASSFPYKKMEDIVMLVTPVQPARIEDEVATTPVNEADSAGIELIPMQESSAPSSPNPERNAGSSEQAPKLRLSGSMDPQKDTSPRLLDGSHELAASLSEEENAFGSTVHTGYCRADQLPECTKL